MAEEKIVQNLFPVLPLKVGNSLSTYHEDKITPNDYKAQGVASLKHGCQTPIVPNPK